MSKTTLNLVRPFGPSVLKTKIPEEVLQKLNTYVDEIIINDEKSKKLNHGNKLVGDVTNEFKLENDELDLEIFSKFLNALKSIEDGECDQHEASYNIGSLLKTMYIDSAVRHANKIENKKQKHGKEAPEKTGKNITWANFKKELK